jgi:hypothetical protein
MKSGLIKAFLALAAAALVLSGCGSDICGPKDPCMPGSFEVKILTVGIEPVEGVWIESGFDWTWLKVKTDSRGVAVLPGSARGRYAEIYKTNYYPSVVSDLEPGEYRIRPTPARVVPIGTVAGRSIRIEPGLLLTLGYSGMYCAYSFDDSSVTELVRAQIEAHAIVDVKLAGSTLWMSTHEDHVFAYSLENPTGPVLINRLDIEGYLGAIAVKGNIIAVASREAGQPVRVYSFTPEGETSLLLTIGAQDVQKMEFKSQCLVIVGYGVPSSSGPATLKIVDLTDESSPRVVYDLVEQGARSGAILDSHVLLGPYVTEGSGTVSYTTISIGDPQNPAYVGRTYSGLWIDDVFRQSYAVGQYCPDYGRYPWCTPYELHYAVAKGGVQSEFSVVAVISDLCPSEWPGVQWPPYFVIGSTLWRLEE